MFQGHLLSHIGFMVLLNYRFISLLSVSQIVTMFHYDLSFYTQLSPSKHISWGGTHRHNQGLPFPNISLVLHTGIKHLPQTNLYIILQISLNSQKT